MSLSQLSMSVSQVSPLSQVVQEFRNQMHSLVQQNQGEGYIAEYMLNNYIESPHVSSPCSTPFTPAGLIRSPSPRNRALAAPPTMSTLTAFIRVWALVPGWRWTVSFPTAQPQAGRVS